MKVANHTLHCNKNIATKISQIFHCTCCFVLECREASYHYKISPYENSYLPGSRSTFPTTSWIHQLRFNVNPGGSSKLDIALERPNAPWEQEGKYWILGKLCSIVPKHKCFGEISWLQFRVTSAEVAAPSGSNQPPIFYKFPESLTAHHFGLCIHILWKTILNLEANALCTWATKKKKNGLTFHWILVL